MKKILLGLTLLLTLSLTLTGCQKEYKPSKLDEDIIVILKELDENDEQILDRNDIENNVLNEDHLAILASFITATETALAEEYLDFDKKEHTKRALEKAIEVNEKITGKYIIGDYDDIENATYLFTGLDLYQNFKLAADRNTRDLYPQDYISFYENEINIRETDGEKLEVLYNLISIDGPNKDTIEVLNWYYKTLTE